MDLAGQTTAAAGYKGEGKLGSLGLGIPWPMPLTNAPHSTSLVTNPTVGKALVAPLAYTAAEVDAMFGPTAEHSFRIPREGFWNTDLIKDVDSGTRVLWKSGKKNGDSTKVELFSGTVHGWLDWESVAVS